MTRRPAKDTALARALAYAVRGWPVFPCRPGRKEPDTPHGFKDATIDPEIITAWWTTLPARNVAIATGAPGPDVLDVDVRPGGSGYQALSRLRRAGLLDPPVAAVATPSGGLHLYYLGTSQPSGRLPAQHLDFKATGGYILAPPSAVGGKPYRPLPHRARGDRAAAPRLDWTAITGLLAPAQPSIRNVRPPGHADTARLAAWVAHLPEGNRNAGLFWAACRAAEAGHSAALDTLAEAAQAAGLGEREIARTIDSARRSAQREIQIVPRRADHAGPRSEPDPEAVT
jgi:Bifunctional DNA primase/polymerase, N-terminal